jgi:DNA mismatch repair protein MutS2
LEIARRFGIPDQVITAASESVSSSSREAVEYLRRIKNDAQEAESLRMALEEERVAVAEKFASLEKQAERRERERQSTFKTELQRTIDEFDRRSRDLVGKIEDQTERLKVERDRQKRVAELKREAQRAASGRGDTSARPVRVVRDGQLMPDQDRSHAKPDNSPDSERYKTVSEVRSIAVGDKVRLRSFGSIGVVDQIKGDEAEVRVRSVKFRERLDNLELVEEIRSEKPVGKFERLKHTSIDQVQAKTSEREATTELNVIGRTTDEAVEAVDKFLDKASLASFSQVRIVHGHGTGALRRAIGELLQGHPHVMRFAAAPQNQGGSGATVVELRQ